MLLRSLMTCTFLAAVPCFASAADLPQTPAKLSAAQIADRNVTARGGLEAWRSVHSLAMSGRIDAGGNARPTLPIEGRKDARALPPQRPLEQVRLPFLMDLKRPLKMRVELQFEGQTAAQVFDGSTGWKLRPFLNRRDVEAYTEDEMKVATSQSELDGPMVDYAAKGTTIDVTGTEKVEDRETYKLKLTFKNGQTSHLWIDAITFLEVKVEGTPRRLDGRVHPVEVYYRDYRTVGGLKIPFVLETKVLGPQTASAAMMPASTSEKIVFDKVEVNPKLEDALFSKQQIDALANGKRTAATAQLSLP